VTDEHDRPGTLPLVDEESWSDLETFLGRAKFVDPDGAARLRADGDVLAVYVSPVHGGGGVDVLGLRVFALSEPRELDVVVELAALTDRLAREAAAPVLAVPPTQLSGVAWAGVAPPRGGWAPVADVPAAAVREVARQGVAEVAAGAPDVAGAPAVSRLRARVWSRPITLVALPAGADVPAGAAFAAESLGFLTGEPVAVRAAGPWRRLSTSAGHVLTRRPLGT
jgi:hypothetical protein